MKEWHIDLMTLAVGVACLVCCAGCVMGETGCKVVIGNHFALPKLSTPNDEVEVEIYESTEGMSFATRKNCIVQGEYSNTYTNTYLGVCSRVGQMVAKWRLEPCAESSELTAAQKEE